MKNVDIDKVYTILKEQVMGYKVPIVDLIEIQTQDPFNVLISTILSSRTNDSTTAAAAKKLFKKVESTSDLEKLSRSEIETLIFPVGFYKNKAKFLKELPKVLSDQFNSKIPDTIEELIKLPGVGRKTANLVVAVAFKKPAICVDVHVHRIMNRLGYIKTKNPLETEMTLRKKLPKKYWQTINSILVAFGQNLCRPMSPHCSICPIENFCNKVNVEKMR